MISKNFMIFTKALNLIKYKKNEISLKKKSKTLKEFGIKEDMHVMIFF